MKRCPKCGHDTFYVSAHVVQCWIVNENREYLQTENECEEVTHLPDDDDIWQCTKCWYCGAGSEFNMKLVRKGGLKYETTSY